jgi:hypothetical protein
MNFVFYIYSPNILFDFVIGVMYFICIILIVNYYEFRKLKYASHCK